MKKYITILALLLICQAGYSQNMDKLFENFAKLDNVTHITLGPVIMKLSSIFTETMGVSGIEVLALEECSSTIKDNLQTAIKELKDPRFETMVTTNEGNSRTKVMIRIDNDMIRELVVLNTGADEALIRIKGKIKPSDIEQIMKEHKHGR